MGNKLQYGMTYVSDMVELTEKVLKYYPPLWLLNKPEGYRFEAEYNSGFIWASNLSELLFRIHEQKMERGNKLNLKSIRIKTISDREYDKIAESFIY